MMTSTNKRRKMTRSQLNVLNRIQLRMGYDGDVITSITIPSGETKAVVVMIRYNVRGLKNVPATSIYAIGVRGKLERY